MRWIGGLAAVLLAGCGGQPAAVPRATPTTPAAPDERGTGYASAFLGAGGDSGSDDLFVHVTVFDPPDADAFGNGEFFVLGWDCLTEERVPATVAGLDSATARGELALTCGSHTRPGEVTGTAVVDLTWTAEGPGHEYTLDSPDGACRELLTDRHAVVTGQVRVVVPELGYDGVAVTLAADDDSLARGVPACP